MFCFLEHSEICTDINGWHSFELSWWWRFVLVNKALLIIYISVLIHWMFIYFTLQSDVNWGKKWFVNFNTSKMRLPSFKHHKEPFSPFCLHGWSYPPETHCAFLGSHFPLSWSGMITLNLFLGLLLGKLFHYVMPDNFLARICCIFISLLFDCVSNIADTSGLVILLYV